MRRREFIALAGAAAAWPVTSRAVEPGKVRRVGFLGLPSADSLPQRTEAFRAGLREHGYREGQDLVIEYRWADSDYARLPALLAELVRANVEVIVTHGTPGALTAKEANLATPVVIAVVGDAVASGTVASLAHPGGNITGLTFFQPELNVKRIELLKEAVTDLTEIGVLLNATNQMNAPVLPQVAEVVRHLGMELRQFAVREASDFDTAFAEMAARKVRGLVIFDDAMLIGHAEAIATRAIAQRLCSCGFLDYAAAGGLLAYGVDFPDMFRRSATYVDKILKGAKPADLPVEQATKFTTILNTATAKLMGLAVPQSLLLRADEVIE